MPYGMTYTEWNEMVRKDREEFILYLERLSNYRFLEENGQLDPDMRKPEPPAFCGELEF